MASVADMIYNYNPQGVYEQNRLRSLMADSELIKQATEQAKLNRQQKIWGLQDALAGGDESARGQLAIYDPEGTAKTAQISRAEMQDAGRFARAYNNAPDDMKAAIAQQMVGYMGKTYGNSLISDIPPISDTANFGNFMSGLAQAVDNMDISGRDLWQAEESAKARAEQQAFDMKKLYASDAMAQKRAEQALENSMKLEKFKQDAKRYALGADNQILADKLGIELTGLPDYDKKLLQEAAKTNAEKQSAIKDLAEMRQGVIDSLGRADIAFKSGKGIGVVEGRATKLFGTGEDADNYADIETANKNMNKYLRKQLASTGLTGGELNSAMEAQAYRYEISPTDNPQIAKRKMDNFRIDVLGMTPEEVEALNESTPTVEKQRKNLFPVGKTVSYNNGFSVTRIK